MPDVTVTLEVILVADGEMLAGFIGVLMLPIVFETTSLPDALGAALAVVGEASFCLRTGPSPEIVVACKPSSKAASKNDPKRMLSYSLDCTLHVVAQFCRVGIVVGVSWKSRFCFPVFEVASVAPTTAPFPQKRASISWCQIVM